MKIIVRPGIESQKAKKENAILLDGFSCAVKNTANII